MGQRDGDGLSFAVSGQRADAGPRRLRVADDLTLRPQGNSLQAFVGSGGVDDESRIALDSTTTDILLELLHPVAEDRLTEEIAATFPDELTHSQAAKMLSHLCELGILVEDNTDYATLIPRTLHFVWIGSPTPSDVSARIERWAALNPDYEIRLWGDEDVRSSDLSNVERAYACESWAQTADLLRYSIVSKYGGIYLDSDMEPLRPLSTIEIRCDLVVCNETTYEPAPYMSIGYLAARPGHPSLAACVADCAVIDLPGVHPPSESGPWLFGKHLGRRYQLLPTETFYPLYYDVPMLPPRQILERFPSAVGVHLWHASWEGTSPS